MAGYLCLTVSQFLPGLSAEEHVIEHCIVAWGFGAVSGAPVFWDLNSNVTH